MPSRAMIEGWQREAPFAELFGLVVELEEGGRSRVRLPWRPEFGNRKGDVHGGAISSLVDLAVGRATRGGIEGLCSVSTVTLNVHFQGPAQGDLIAHGRATKIRQTIAFAEATVENAQGEVVATGVATFRVFRPESEHKRSTGDQGRPAR